MIDCNAISVVHTIDNTMMQSIIADPSLGFWFG